MKRLAIKNFLVRHIWPKGTYAWIRAGALISILVLIIIYAGVLTYVSLYRYEPQEGDIIFQSLYPVEIVRAIEGATHSPYSHCGLVLRDKDGRWFVREALGTVHDTAIKKFVIRGRLGAMDIYRMKTPPQDLGPKLHEISASWLGWPYDSRYRPDDNEIYCSELVWKSYHKMGIDLGQWRTLGSLDWQPYEKTIRKLESGGLPLDRPMITPRAVAESDQLNLVYSWGSLGERTKPLDH